MQQIPAHNTNRQTNNSFRGQITAEHFLEKISGGVDSKNMIIVGLKMKVLFQNNI